MTRRPIAITAGDPAGIGPDLLAALPAALPDLPLVLLADRDVLAARAAALGLELSLPEWAPGRPAPEHGAVLWHCPAGATVTAGQPDPATGAGTLAILERAADGCLDGTFAAMVTAPVASPATKAAMNPLPPTASARPTTHLTATLDSLSSMPCVKMSSTRLPSDFPTPREQSTTSSTTSSAPT